MSLYWSAKEEKKKEGLLAESHDLRHSTLYFLRAHCTDVYASTSQKISFAFFLTTAAFLRKKIIKL